MKKSPLIAAIFLILGTGAVGYSQYDSFEYVEQEGQIVTSIPDKELFDISGGRAGVVRGRIKYYHNIVVNTMKDTRVIYDQLFSDTTSNSLSTLVNDLNVYGSYHHFAFHLSYSDYRKGVNKKLVKGLRKIVDNAPDDLWDPDTLFIDHYDSPPMSGGLDEIRNYVRAYFYQTESMYTVLEVLVDTTGAPTILFWDNSDGSYDNLSSGTSQRGPNLRATLPILFHKGQKKPWRFNSYVESYYYQLITEDMDEAYHSNSNDLTIIFEPKDSFYLFYHSISNMYFPRSFKQNSWYSDFGGAIGIPGSVSIDTCFKDLNEDGKLDFWFVDQYDNGYYTINGSSIPDAFKNIPYRMEMLGGGYYLKTNQSFFNDTAITREVFKFMIDEDSLVIRVSAHQNWVYDNKNYDHMSQDPNARLEMRYSLINMVDGEIKEDLEGESGYNLFMKWMKRLDEILSEPGKFLN